MRGAMGVVRPVYAFEMGGGNADKRVVGLRGLVPPYWFVNA